MEALFLNLLITVSVAFSVTFYLVPIFCAIAYRLGFVDEPNGTIKRQLRATPYLGGVAVYLGFVSALSFFVAFRDNLFLFLWGTTWLLLVGLFDDFISLDPRYKFFGQSLACVAFLKAGLYARVAWLSPWVAIPVSLFWILSIINAFNLVDVMDGLTATIGIGAAVGLCFFAIILKAHTALFVLMALVGSLAAFLWYNKPVARIYLGDAGSLFVGGVLATVPFMIDWGAGPTNLCIIIPGILLAIPSLEITSLMVVRRIKGIPFYQGSLDHFSSYMQQHGLSKHHILAIMCLLSLVLIVGSYLIFTGILSPVATLISACLFLLIWFYLVFFYTKRVYDR